MMASFTSQVKQVIKQIPRGKIATYGQIAKLAGNSRAARQVAWILHSSSRKDVLPWHRVINSKGKISLPPNRGGELQKNLLEKEGIIFNRDNSINLKKYLWNF